MEQAHQLDNIDMIRAAVHERIEQERLQYATDPGQEQNEDDLSPQEISDALQRNEDGDAWLYVEIHSGKFCFDAAAGRWYRWSGHSWEKDSLNEATRAIEAVVEKYAEEAGRKAWQRLQATKAGKTEEARGHKEAEDSLLKRIRSLQAVNRKENVLTLARTGADSLAIRGDEWDRDPLLLAVQNGIVDLKTGDLRPGRPEDFIKTIAPVEYWGLLEPSPVWERFISEIFGDVLEIGAFMQRLLGYSLTGLTTEHIAPILWGEGRNGKTTLVEVVSHVMGGHAGIIESEMLLSQKHGRQSGGPSPDIMALRGKRFVYCSETESGRHFNVSRFKWLSGGDTLTGRELYGKELVSFAPTHKIFLSTNHRPHANADDYAFWKRAILIPFTLSFVDDPQAPHERKVDPHLPGKLKAEAPGILSWMVRGCLEWQRQGLNPPDSVRAATQEYQEDEDILKHFIDDRCLLRPELTVKAGWLYQEYKDWCNEMGHAYLNGTNFGMKMKRKFQHGKDRQGVHYKGIGLLESTDR